MTQIARNIVPSIPAVHAETGKLPPLQNGDHLTREEFESRFDATPNLKRAELIEGRVYLPPPTSFGSHSTPHGILGGLLFTYWLETPGVYYGDAGSIRLDNKNMPQPDVLLMIQPTCGGQAKIDDSDYVAGAPEFAGEIAASSANYDLYEKLRLYERYGVREYIVWRTLDGQIDYFILRNGHYEPLVTTDSIFRSESFGGLWIDAGALLSGDPVKAVAELRKGLASPEHAAFVEALRAKANR